MHEIGMCQAVLKTVEQRADGRSVRRLGVRAGTLLRVVPEAFEQSFEMVATDSVAEGAEIEVTLVPVQVRCRACQAEFTSDEEPLECPSCSSEDLDQDGGDELILEWLEYAATGDGAVSGEEDAGGT